MKVGRYKGPDDSERLGIVLGEEPGLHVLDLGVALQNFGRRARFDNTMNSLIDAGQAGMDDAYEIIDWAQREGESSWLFREIDVEWLTPVRVRNCIMGGRNFGKHVEETLEYWRKQGAKFHFDFPMGFVKLPSVMVGTRATVCRPEGVNWFDYEIEATAVIGRNADSIPEERALEAVFGYTILNDLSARELQRKEMANQSILLGKNFPGFGPLGPWILTADEVPDPAALKLRLTVNDEVRQEADCSDLIFPFPKMISHWSRMGLARGDLITTGSPEGVAIGRPDPEAFYLKPGDIVRATVEQIGTLETRIA